MEKKNYILLFLQIAAIAVSGVLGGDTTFALITALIGITFNFLVSMNIASGFLFGFVYAVCNGILEFPWQYFSRSLRSTPHWRYSSSMEKAAGEQLLNLLSKGFERIQNRYLSFRKYAIMSASESTCLHD